MSNGDFLLTGNLLAQKDVQLDATNVGSSSFGVENQIQIYKDGKWWDPTKLNPNLWNTKNWDPFDLNWDPIQNGFAKYADQLSNVGKIAISPSGGEIGQLIGPMFDVELRFSPSSYGEFLNLADSQLASSLSLSQSKTTEINYAVMITTTRGSIYGYPVRPSIQDNSNTFSMLHILVNFIILTYLLYLV